MDPTEPSIDEHGARAARLAYEPLLADLSVRFANTTIDGIEAEVESALAQLVRHLGYDRCTYGELALDGSFAVVCSVAAAGLEPLPRGPRRTFEPWLIERYRTEGSTLQRISSTASG